MELLNHWMKSVKGLFTKPTQFFENVEERNSLGFALSFSAISGLISGLITATIFSTGFIFADAPLHLALFIPIAAMIIAPIGLLINSTFVHIAVHLFGGSGYSRTTEAITYATVSQALLSWIPVIGGPITLIYTIFLEVKGLKRFQDLSTGKALIASLLPIIIFIIIGIIMAILLAGVLVSTAGQI